MAFVDKHPPGAFCWIELATPDQSAAKNFYSTLFGWTVQDSPIGPGEVYTIFQLHGRPAAAAYTMRPDQTSQGIPPNWLLYVSVESADASAARAAELGGRVLQPAFDVSEFGRMAVIQDPAGAVFALWQPRTHIGIGVESDPGSLCWADLNTPDVSGAVRFYEGLFGWKLSAGEGKDASGYLHILNDGRPIGGIPPAEERNQNVPPHWMIYLAVEDVFASVEKARSLGAAVQMPATTIEHVGDLSVLADPQGAVFAMFTPEKKDAT